MQWTLFGLPMYTVRLPGPPPEAPRPPRQLEEVPAAESFGGAVVHRREASSLASLPPFLTRLDLQFDFSAAGVYRRFHSSPAGDGDPSTREELQPNDSCPSDPNGGGCYFTLNGLATGQADLPVQPYFVYSSRLSGTSQHGVLWKGGTFREETPWQPLRGVLQSNNTESFENLGALPEHILPRIRPTRFVPGQSSAATSCPPTDLELNQLVLPTGETVGGTRQRIDLTLDLEIFYFNDTTDSATNCDRQGPALISVNHTTRGTAADFEVVTGDPSEVWRVVVVVHDGTLDAQNEGRWEPVELTLDSPEEGSWRGSYDAGAPATLDYFVQAVDRSGNVSWWLFSQTGEDQPTSGIPTDLPQPEKVEILLDEVDLALTLADSPDPVPPGGTLRYTVRVANHDTGDAAETASGIVVTTVLPAGFTFVGALGTSWSCGNAASLPENTVECGLPSLAPGAISPALVLVVDAPAAAGYFAAAASVAALQGDDAPADNTAEVMTLVSGGPFPPAALPTVTASSFAGEPLLPCGTLRQPVRGWRLDFSEAMRDPPGDGRGEDVGNPANYRLIEPGPDRDFATTGCAGAPAGDDRLLPIGDLDYQASPSPALTLTFGNRALPPGLYRLLACGTLHDLGDQPLDGNGDGTPGDDFFRELRVDPFDKLVNAHFDTCGGPSLEPWQTEGSPAAAITPGGEDSGGSSPLSAAALLESDGEALGLGQCVELGATRWLLQSARLRVASPGAGDGELPAFHGSCDFFAAATCGGSLLDTAAASLATYERSPPEWKVFEQSAAVPEDASSAFCRFGFGPALLPFTGELDRLFVSGEALLFADGFESGDISTWSATP